MEGFFRQSHQLDGAPLVKQSSFSLNNAPSGSKGFQEFFMQKSKKEEGWLELRTDTRESRSADGGDGRSKWKRYWFIFDERVLHYGENETDIASFKSVDMDKVVSIRTDNTMGNTSFRLTTTESKLHLRAPNEEERKKWLFVFQRSVALVLSHIMSTKKPSDYLAVSNNRFALNYPNKTSPTANAVKQFNSDASLWMNELGYGHGKQSYMMQRRRSSFNSKLNADDDNNDTSPKTGIESSTSAFQRIAIPQQSSPSVPSPTSNLTSALAAGLKGQSNTSSNNSIFAQSLDTGSSIFRVSSRNSDSGSEWDRSMYGRSASDLSQMFAGESGNTRANSSDSTAYDAHSIPIQQGDSNAFQPRPQHPYGYSSSLPTTNQRHLWAQAAEDKEKIAGSFVESRSSILKDLELNKKLALDEVDEGDENSDDEEDEESDDDHRDDGIFEMDDGSSSHPSHQSPSVSTSIVNRAVERNSPEAGRGLSMAGSLSNGSTLGNRHFRNGSFTAALGLSDSALPTEMAIRLSSGYCTKQGPRKSNEDRLIAITDLHAVMELENNAVLAGSSSSSSSSASALKSANGGARVGTPSKDKESIGYFAVYDGHCGDQASTFLECELHKAIYRHPLFATDLQQAITDTCINTDKLFLQICKETNIYAGTTALGAIIRGNLLTVFNIGDCQAVLCTAGKPKLMCNPHKPGREDEKRRIEQANGWVTEESELYMARLHVMDLSDPVVRDKAQAVSYVKIHRVCAELSIARSIGDPDYKGFIPGEVTNSFFLWPDGHNQIFQADLVIPDPEFMTAMLSSEDEFLIVACDGIWDVLSEEDAVKSVSSSIAIGKSVSQAAEVLCDLAIRLGSSDNVTAVIVQFNHHFR